MVHLLYFLTFLQAIEYRVRELYDWMMRRDVRSCFVKIEELGNVGWRIRLIFIRDVDVVFVFRLELMWEIDCFIIITILLYLYFMADDYHKYLKIFFKISSMPL